MTIDLAKLEKDAAGGTGAREMTRRAELTTATVVYDAESEKAIFVLAHEGAYFSTWFLKSACTIDPPHPAQGDTVTITASEWALQQKGLI